MATETEESIESGGRGKRRTEERAIHEDGGHGGRVVLDRIAIVGVGRGRVVVKKSGGVWRELEREGGGEGAGTGNRVIGCEEEKRPGTRSLDMAVVGEDTWERGWSGTCKDGAHGNATRGAAMRREVRRERNRRKHADIYRIRDNATRRRWGMVAEAMRNGEVGDGGRARSTLQEDDWAHRGTGHN